MRRASSSAVDVNKKEGRDDVVLRIDNVPWVCFSLFKLAMDAVLMRQSFRTLLQPKSQPG